VSAADVCPVVVDPAAHESAEPAVPGAPLGTLSGRRVRVLDITKVRSDVFAAEVARGLREAGAAVETGIALPAQRMSDAELDAVAAESDGAVLALADCGTCTSWTLWDAVELNRRGVRTVLVSTDALRPTVAALAPRLGLADLPLVTVATPNRDHGEEEIRATAAAAGQAIAEALTGSG
jgi:hypothetical protein